MTAGEESSPSIEYSGRRTERVNRANMIHSVAKYARAAATIRGRAISVRSSSVRYSIPSRAIHGEISVPNANHLAIQMVNYALSHARSQKSGFFNLTSFP